MSDGIKPDQDNNKKPLDDQPVESRRRFAKSGLAGGAVLMSLLSRPALGNDIACTGSILASIDAGTSLHGGLDCQDQVGCSADYWCSAGAFDWERISSLSSITSGTQFGAIFGCGPWPPIESVDVSPAISSLLCNTLDTDIQIPDIQIQAARQSVACLLNAIILNATTSLGPIFGPTAAEIVADYCSNFGINDSACYTAMLALNSRSCPLNNDPDNFFYQLGS